jgi:small-conductance mechanosensitive channel
MSNVENLVLEHLRALRAGQDRIELKLSEVNARLSTQEDVYRQQAVVDRLSDRLDRIERRLELTG